MLEFLLMRGEVAISGRIGRGRLWDLAERVYPGRRRRSLGRRGGADQERATPRLPRNRAAEGTAMPIEPVIVGEAGEPAVVDGTEGEWRRAVAPSRRVRGTALLSPSDRLVYDRVRAKELFKFEYILEMYKPAAKRRWGYFALPILHVDRLVGKLDATADRKAGVLRVNAIHEDVDFTRATTEAVWVEIADLAAWRGLGAVA
ncbi:MAG TPA: crosslink repair DNA glycosylase YcaQ family protein [Gaiellaceae bacterium]|nr:crosslink repair DNA glycosylase YcaQ family protein [Gaiellaceae bacterium]